MSSDGNSNLERVRQILQRMDRSITDARSKRLHDDEPDNLADDKESEQATTNNVSDESQTNKPTTTAPGNTPVRFGEDGRPIVGRAKPKKDLNNNPPAPPPSNSTPIRWR